MTTQATESANGAAAKAGAAGPSGQGRQRDWLHDLASAPLSAEQCLQWLQAFAERGWLRRLDSALASQLHRLDARVSPAVLVAAALLAHMEGRGHTCLSVHDLVKPAFDGLAWPDEAWHGPQGLLALWAHMPPDAARWCLALQAAPHACLRLADAPDAGQPLVLNAALVAVGAEGAVGAVGAVAPVDGARAPQRPERLAAAAPLLYLRRYWFYEERVGQNLLQRAQSALPVPEALARDWLDRFFGQQTPSGVAPEDQTDWQKLACAVALRANLAVITGGPGTGKTYTAARLLALLLALHEGPSPLRVALAAPTGKAAARLKQSIDGSLQALQPMATGAGKGDLDLDALVQRIGPARTLHSLLGARPDTRGFKHHAGHLLDLDVLIVDEASMVHLEMMDALLQALPPKARLVLLGDKDQLASVEAGAVLGDVCRDAAQGAYQAETLRYAQVVAGQVVAPCFAAKALQAVSALSQQTVMLRKSRRFDGPIGQLALAVNAGDAAQVAKVLALPAGPQGQALRALHADTPERVCELALGQLQANGQDPAPRASYIDYLQHMRALPPQGDVPAHAAWVMQVLQRFDRFRILCAVHRGDWGTTALNAAVQKALAQAGWLKPQGEWYAGRPVMVTRNDAPLGVFNGDVGVVLPSAQGVLKAWFLEGEQLRSVSVARLAHAETAFVMTVHKSQGSEFEHTALVLPPGARDVLSRELVYTGITRAKTQFTLMQALPGLLDAAMARPSVRASGLHQWWDGP